MAKGLITQQHLNDIADAIRGRNNSLTEYKPSEMAAAVTAIPNSYTAEDEGKVVSNAALVAQTARATEITENGTYDTTENNSVIVNVSGGGGIDRSKQNSSIAGDCYIKEGKITGFTSYTSVWFPRDASNSELVVDWSQPFVIHIRFTLNNTYNGSQALYGATASGVYFVLPTCEIRQTEFWFGFTTNGSSWTDEISISSVPILANSEYEISVVYDGTKIKVTVSDGTNKQVAETTPATALYNSNSRRIGFGGIARNSNLIARYVAFDPDDTYIESNGSIVWGTKS